MSFFFLLILFFIMIFLEWKNDKFQANLNISEIFKEIIE